MMAAYVTGSNVQAETTQTLHLMNPGLSGCADAAPASTNDVGSNNQHQHFMGYSAQPLLQAMYMPEQSPSVPLPGRMSPYVWTNSTTTNEVPFVSVSDATPLSHVFASRYASAVTPESQYSHFNVGRQQEGATLGSNAVNALSLSLSPGHHLTQIPFYDNIHSDTLAAIPDLTYVVGDKRGDRVGHMGYATQFKNPSENESLGANLHNYMSDMSGRHTQTQMHVQIEPSSAGGYFAQSKYLKAAQQLLTEVVSVEDAIKKGITQARHAKMGIYSHAGDVVTETGTAGRDGMLWGLSIAKSASCSDIVSSMAVELTPQARQDLQLKKAKLMAMLEEVDRRYKLYRTQLQAIASIFESAAGAGAARCYTALALQTISRHFRCLRDAIAGQVRATGKGLGEEDLLSQQRALQHLHMMHQHAWRPQRGLPERAVSVLRAWLFEHFLHPYPKDADKVLLAKQTGLTRNQVSNWFINARVRLWKPMVEEMYQEEARDDEMGGKSDAEKERDEMRAGLAALKEPSLRGMDSDLLRNVSTDQYTGKGSENDIQMHQFATAAHSQNTLPEASMVATNLSYSLQEWQGVKKARNAKDSFAGSGEIYSCIQAEEDKEPYNVGMPRIDPQSYNSYLSNAGASRANASGTTVSLTLGLQQHKDPIEAPVQAQPQQQHMFYHHAQQPGFLHGHGTVLQHVSQALPEAILERINVGDVATAQNYLPSLTGTNFELLTQVQNQKQLHGHSLPPDFTS